MAIRPFVIVCLTCAAATIAAAQEKAATAAAPAAKRNLQVDDLFRIKTVGDPQVSPDGRWVAYTVVTASLKEDKSETQVWMTPADGGEPLPMTAKGTSASVWLLDRRGGEAQGLTEVPQGVESFEWAPDGRRLVLRIKDPSPEELDAQKHKDAGTKPVRPKAPSASVVDRLQIKRDYEGYLDRRRTHLYVFDLAGKKLAQVTSGDHDDRNPVWSPDGRFVAFVSNHTEDPDANYDSNVWVVAADNPDKGQTLIQVTTNAGDDEQPAWSPDGRWIAYVTNPEPKLLWYATMHLALLPAPMAGGAQAEPKLLTKPLDRNVRAPQFAPDSASIYFRLEDSGEEHVARIAVAGGAVTRPLAGPRAAGQFTVGKDGTIAALVSDPHAPDEVFLLKGGAVRQLTHTNKQFLDEIRLADFEEVQFKSKDGTAVEGFILKPPGFSPELQYPALLRIHGGPVAQYDKTFSFEDQLFAAHGYVVLMPNPRGSSGYGQDFSRAIFADWGNKDTQDVLASVDYAVAQGYVDADRLGVGGWVTFTGPGRMLVEAEPTFEALSRHTRLAGGAVTRVPLTPRFEHDLPRMLEAARHADLVYICNPNNPTATITNATSLREFVAAVPAHTVILVDEAYHHYVTSPEYGTLMDLVPRHPNLIVARTFSKIFGMAGLRCGYCVSNPETIRRLAAHQGWDSVSTLTVAAARASLGDERHVADHRERNLATRSFVRTEVERLGKPVLPSEANFLMIDMGRDVAPVIASFRDRGVDVGRRFAAMPQHLRVSIGTPEEMKRFVEEFARIMRSNG